MIALKNILVATDFSAPSEAALIYGRTFARSYGATLHVLHVVEDVAARVAVDLAGSVPNIGALQQDLENEARRRLDAFVPGPDRSEIMVRATVLTSSAPAQMILSYAKDAQIDLIVIGTHGRTGLSRLFMGSVAQHVVRLAPCPVLTVRHPEREFVQPDALQIVTPQDARH